MTVSLRALAPVKHTCTGCGGSCMGVRARLISADETTRITTLSAELGVADPIVDGALRQVDGKCVFLADDFRCGLHAKFGAASKPFVCRQYPVVAVDTGTERRVGIDPGCYTAYRTAKTGDDVAGEGLGVVTVKLDATAESQEFGLLGLLRAAPSVRTALGNFAAPGLEARWLARLRQAEVGALIARPETGPAGRAALAPLAAALAGELPTNALTAESDAWIRECARRMVFLRLQPALPPVAVAALVLLGGTTIGQVDPSIDRVAPALAAWCRALRAPLFVRALVPDAASLRTLLTGS
jgi:hypothetical protein